ncbi:PKP4 [Cordylochernes scorpioides]|uniref:PKP4 n=1 Tax=Cordylochernes scorpioides TaxID=51811 RepID=A0ABY6KM26_9ARAC|nr:PKP4 [Cordylochernes scorpioides]
MLCQTSEVAVLLDCWLLRALGGIPPLVELLNQDIPEIQKNACGALRNLSYGRQNDENKCALCLISVRAHRWSPLEVPGPSRGDRVPEPCQLHRPGKCRSLPPAPVLHGRHHETKDTVSSSSQ